MSTSIITLHRLQDILHFENGSKDILHFENGSKNRKQALCLQIQNHLSSAINSLQTILNLYQVCKCTATFVFYATFLYITGLYSHTNQNYMY